MDTHRSIIRTGTPLRLILLPLLLILLPAPSASQFQFIVHPPVFTDYPRIEIPFEVLDNTAAVDSLTAEDFIVYEDGVRMLPVEVECGDMQIAPKIYFYFLIDVSFSMGFREDTTLYDPDSVKWRTAKQVFVDAFARLRPQDEGALGSFARTFIQEQAFTSDKRLLADATGGMFLRSGTSIYDAIEIASSIANEKEGKKVIILLTDGVDNGSRLTREQAINFAWNRGVPVYPIGLGLYFDPDQPFRVDEDTLRRIAAGTGGKAYFAPTSEDLSQIFEDIIESIYSIGCVLRYATPDTCRDGGRRQVEIQANIRGSVLTERFSYTLEDLRSRLHLSLDLPVEALSAGTRYTIPVRADGEIRPDEPMDFDVTLRYDPMLFEVLGVAQTGSVLDPGAITVTPVAAGEMRFSGSGLLPRRGIPYATDVLFAIDMQVRNRSELAEAQFDLLFPAARQICEIVPSASPASTVVHACPEQVVLGFDTTIIAIPGRQVDVPLLLDTRIDFHQSLRYLLSVDFDGTLFTYTGFSIDGTISEHMDVSVIPAADRLLIQAKEGMPHDTSRILLVLHFQTAVRKAGQPVVFRLRDGMFVQRGIDIIAADCVPPVQLIGAQLYADGVCQPILRRKKDLALGPNSPNPVSAQGGQTRFSFRVTGAGPVTLEIVDEFGRRCALLVEGFLPAGRHEAVWRPGSVPSGVYLGVLREGGEIRTQKVLVTR